ncbi:MAG TPA: hypothetical protein VN908_10890 [Gemmatimonadales bacterium]|nr:hypothetical protein [Gemmatimonadales bacterium]
MVNLIEALHVAIAASAFIALYSWLRVRSSTDPRLRRRARLWTRVTIVGAIVAAILYITVTPK